MSEKKRSVTITLNGHLLDYEFKGPWSGIDVRRAMTHFGRKYRLYIRALRRGEVTVDEEVSDEKVKDSSPMPGVSQELQTTGVGEPDKLPN